MQHVRKSLYPFWFYAQPVTALLPPEAVFSMTTLLLNCPLPLPVAKARAESAVQEELILGDLGSLTPGTAWVLWALPCP